MNQMNLQLGAGERRTGQGMPYVLVLMGLASQTSVGLMSVLMGIGVLCTLYDLARRREALQMDPPIGRVLAFYSVSLIIGNLMCFPVAYGIRDALSALYKVVPFFLAVFYLKNWRTARLVFLAMAVSMLVNDVVAVHQEYGYLQNHTIGRLTGMTEHPTMLGAFLLLVLPLVTFLPKVLRFSRRQAWFLWGVAALSFLVLMFSQSRGTWMAFFGTLVLFVGMERQHRMRHLKVAGIAIVVFAVVLGTVPALQQRMHSVSDTNLVSNTERILMWKGALQIWQDHPLFGSGAGTFRQHFDSPEYRPPEAKEPFHLHPHNYFLKVLSEQGIWGLFFYLWLHGLIAWQLYERWRHPCGKAAQVVALCGLLAFAGFHFAAITDTALRILDVARMYWLTMGAYLAAAQLKDEEAEE